MESHNNINQVGLTYQVTTNDGTVSSDGYLAVGLSGEDTSVVMAGDGTLQLVANGLVALNSTSAGVGIGMSTAPDGFFHVQESVVSGAPYISTAVGILEAASQAVTLQLVSDNNQSSDIRFGDSDDGNIGGLLYSHGDDSLSLIANNGTRLFVKSDGKIGIGTAGPQSVLDIEGNCAIGAAYSGSSAAPANGLIVEGNMGVGTTSPDRTFHVHKATAGSIISHANAIATLENSTDAWLQFLTPNSDRSGVIFGDVDNNSIGSIEYDHSVDSLFLKTVSTTAATVSSDGYIGISTTTPVSLLTIQEVTASGQTPDPGSASLVLDSGTKSNGMSVLSPAGAEGTYAFGRPDTQLAGFMRYDHLIDSLEIGTAGLQRVAVNSSGDVGIGIASPTEKLHVIGDAKISGDIDSAGGHKTFLGQWFRAISDASGAVPLGTITDGTLDFRVRPGFAGSVVGITVAEEDNTSLTGGTATFTVDKNGSPISGADVVLTTGESHDSITFAKDTYAFAASDELSVSINYSGLATTPMGFIVYIIVEF